MVESRVSIENIAGLSISSALAQRRRKSVVSMTPPSVVHTVTFAAVCVEFVSLPSVKKMYGPGKFWGVTKGISPEFLAQSFIRKMYIT
jgi:hypothetical protein